MAGNVNSESIIIKWREKFNIINGFLLPIVFAVTKPVHHSTIEKNHKILFISSLSIHSSCIFLLQARAQALVLRCSTAISRSPCPRRRLLLR